MDTMKHLVTTAALLFSLLLTSTGAFAQSSLGDTPPSWTLMTPQKEKITYTPKAEGKPTVMMFWATWCPTCHALLPHLEKLHKDLGLRANVYTISLWEDSAEAPAQLWAEKKYTLPLLLNGERISKAYGVKGTPWIVMTDAAGQVIYKRQSGETPEQVMAAIRARVPL